MSELVKGTVKVTEILLDCGETCLVSSITMHVRRALIEKSQQLFPYPNEADFERAADPEVSLFDDQTIPASHDKEYQRLKNKADVDRASWMNEQIILHYCQFPAGQKELIKQYAGKRKELATFIDLPEDDWQATLFYILLSDSDRNNILHASMSNLELTEGEVREGLHYFRPKVRRGGHPNGTGH